MARSYSDNNANFKSSMGLGAIISQLEQLQAQMEKTFGKGAKTGIINMKLILNTSDAVRAIQELSKQTVRIKVQLDTSDIARQVQNSVKGVSFGAGAPVAGGGVTSAAAVGYPALPMLPSAYLPAQASYAASTGGFGSGGVTDWSFFNSWARSSGGGMGTPSYTSANQGMNTAGLYFLSQALTSMGYQIKNAFDSVAQNYDQSALSFRKTELVSGMSGSQFQEYKEDLLSLAPETMTSLPVLSEMGYSFATRGYMRPETASKVIEPIAITGLITGEDPVTMAKSTMSLMQIWNPSSLESLEQRAPRLVRDYADLTAYAYSSSPLETRWFKDIANYAAPVYAGLGFGPEETMSTFMAMSQMIPTAGIGARSARMAVSNLFDIDKLQGVTEKYGIDLQSSLQAVRDAGGGLAEVFQEVFNSVNSLPEWEQNAFTRDIGGGVRGGMAIQSFLPVIGNIQEYQRNIAAEAEGYTYMKQMEYQATPYGQLQAAEAEREALLYGVGEETVGIRTVIMQLENSLLKVVQSLPKEALAGGYTAARTFEFFGNATAQFANLAILRQFTSGGMLGKIGTGIGTVGFIAPLAAGAVGAAQVNYQEGQQADMQALIDELKGKNIMAQGDYIGNRISGLGISSREYLHTLGNDMPLNLFGANDYSFLSGDTDIGQALGDSVWERAGKFFKSSAAWYGFDEPYKHTIGGELASSEEVNKLLKDVSERWSQGQKTVVSQLPISEESKKLVEEQLAQIEDWVPSMENFNLANLSYSLKSYLKSTPEASFGEITGIDEMSPVDRQKAIVDAVNKQFENFQEIQVPESMTKTGLIDPVGMYNKVLQLQGDVELGVGDSDRGVVSKSDIENAVKYMITDESGSLFGVYSNTGEAVDFYTQILSIVKEFSDLITTNNELTAEGNEALGKLSEAEKGQYMEGLASWLAGETSSMYLPGTSDQPAMALAWEEGNRANSLMIGFPTAGRDLSTYEGLSTQGQVLKLMGEIKTKEDITKENTAIKQINTSLETVAMRFENQTQTVFT